MWIHLLQASCSLLGRILKLVCFLCNLGCTMSDADMSLLFSYSSDLWFLLHPQTLSLFSVCFSSHPELSFVTLQRKPRAEGWKMWVWAWWAAGTVGYIGRIYSSGFPVSPGELPWWLRWWRICLKYRRPGFDSWFGKIPWRRKWQPTPYYCLENPGTEEPGGQRGVAKSQTQVSS